MRIDELAQLEGLLVQYLIDAGLDEGSRLVPCEGVATAATTVRKRRRFLEGREKAADTRAVKRRKNR